MDTIRQTLQGDQIIPLPLLQDLGRQTLRRMITGESEKISLLDLEQLWVKLRATAGSADVTDRHLRACCNAVCVFLTCIAQSQHQEVRRIAFSKSTWSQNLDIVHKGFVAGRGKAAMQVLGTTIQLLLDNPDPAVAREMLRDTVHQMMRVIITGSPESHLKESCIVLSHLLHKTGLLLPLPDYFSGLDAQTDAEYSRRCKRHRIDDSQLDPRDCDVVTRLFLALLFIAGVPESHTAALKFFSYLCTLEEDSDHSKHITCANKAITVYLASNPDALPDFSKHVLPAVINTREQFLAFLTPQDPDNINNVQSLNTLLAILEVGRQKSFIDESELALFLDQASLAPSTLIKTAEINMSGLGTLLSCKEPGFRLQAFSLLTMSPLTNAKIPSRNLDCLAKNLRYLHDDSDAYYRDEFTSILRRFLERFGRSAAATQREEQIDDEQQGEKPTVAYYRPFMNIYLNFLKSEMSPNASYPRHILALQTLRHIFDAELVAILDARMDVTMCTLIDPLLSLVLDPFEDVRRESTFLLQDINMRVKNASLTTMQKYGVLSQAYKRSAVTHRGDHADALARLHMLSAMSSPGSTDEQVEKNTFDDSECHHLVTLVHSLRVHVDSVDHLGPANSFPLHGTLSGIAYCISIGDRRSSEILTRLKTPILDLCKAIWLFVLEELCVDTPERTIENTELDDLVGPKDLLAYSWRALRDSSLILQSVLKAPHEGSALGLYEDIGNICLEQLIKLRHRGAFSTVAQTFVLCCQKTRSHSDTANSSVLCQQWFRAAFSEIEEQAAKLTRRSAGLPAIFAALLDPSEPKVFKKSVDELVHIATAKPVVSPIGPLEGDVKLPQVHALNCLKDIMLNSRFRSVSEPIVVTMLNLAAQCLASDVWAIRNCGLMLFRACIGRLTPEISLSTSEEANGIDAATPLATAIKLIESTTDHEHEAFNSQDTNTESSSEIIFAALDLLGRIPLQISTQTLINDIYISQLGNRLWSVREHAARLRAMNVSPGTELATLRALLANLCLFPLPALNELHGRVLCSRYILLKVWAAAASENDKIGLEAIGILQDFITEVFTVNADPYVIAVCLDTLNDAYGYTIQSSVVHQQVKTCSELVLSFVNERANSPQFYLLHRSICLNNIYRYLYAMKIPGYTDDQQQGLYYSSNNALIAKHFGSPDTALYVLEELKKSSAVQDVILLQELYLNIAISDSFEDIRMEAMRNLAQRWQISGVQIPILSVQRLLQHLNLYKPCGREIFNAQIMLASQIITYTSDTTPTRVFNITEQLVSALQQSLCDEIEAPTRLNAALSLQSLIPYLLHDGGRTVVFSRTDRFRVLCIMYDFLNDDDEEIREAAIVATHRILLQNGSWRKLLPPCAAAARGNLLALLRVEFGHTTEYLIRVLAVILGRQADIIFSHNNNFASLCLDEPVDDLLCRALERADELFAEEKQNLYIDEIDEIMAWSASVSTPLLAIGSNMLVALQNWTLAGLQSLTALLDASAGQESNLGPLGPSYREDVLVIFMRCIAVAGLLIKSESTSYTDIEGSAVGCAINRHVATLREHALKSCAHYKITEILELVIPCA